MFLFGLEGSGFIISLALTLLISGAIMFYCLKRFNVLENSIMEQGRVLQSFIIRAQQGGLGGQQSSAPPPGLATDIAIKSAREQTKIEVSDDEEGNMEEVSSSDVTSDSDSDDNIVYDTSDHSFELQTEEITTVKLDADEVVMPHPTLVDALPDDPATVKIVSIEDIGTSLLSLNLDSASESSETENDLIDELDIEQVSALPLEKIEINKKQPLSKMRVDHLRDLAIESGHVTNMEAAKKLKKDELLQLLQ